LCSENLRNRMVFTAKRKDKVLSKKGDDEKWQELKVA
jgi:hypothetical protein